MSRPNLTLIFLAVFVSLGCVATLSPLYTDEVLARDERIEGIWFSSEGNGQSISIARGREGYIFVVDSPTQSKRFEANLVELGDQRFLDVYSGDSWETDVVHVHNILRIRVTSDGIYTQALDKDKVEEAMEADGTAHFAVKMSGGRRLVLTSPTADLQGFLKKHGEAIFSQPRLYKKRLD